ncbi:hypothetical protein G3I62_05140 [Streptomyces sp. SID14446]|uniref:hypothetical protein n=1 Tax=Streptomyces sp. SID14446 TaxID=2706072 RepID=UPI0013B76B80|nr:hypothetical protein [Streptomyces sp. SID14446]NEB28491.1 hypothetical protein [Streptomyces sp. SID14446]
MFRGGPDPEATTGILAEQPFREGFDDVADLEAALEVWEERLTDVRYGPRFTSGALCLSDEGCGLTAWLVVTGSQRGHMWRDPRSDGEDLHPIRAADSSQLDLAVWYFEWLAAAEAARGLDRWQQI